MLNRPSLFALSAVAAMLLGAFVSTPAKAASVLTGNYFKIPYADPDMEKGIDGVHQGLVTNTLGPNGLPVASTYGQTLTDPEGPITMIDPTTKEIQWWTPGYDGIQFEKTQNDTLPFVFPNFYPDGQGADYPTYRSVHWQGSFNLASPGSVTLSLGSDDDVWAYIDGVLQIDDGGVHGVSYVPNVISGLSGGNHTLDIFFADRHTVGSEIDFDADVTLNPSTVPEPSTLSLLGFGLPALLAYRRRK
jgi:fibro-slime domain-containing protein